MPGAGFYRNVLNETTGEWELVREDDEMPDINDDDICKNDKCILDILHKAKGVAKCVETDQQDPPSGNGAAINADEDRVDPSAWYNWRNWQSKMPDKCRHEPTPAYKVPSSGITFYGGSNEKVNEYGFDGLVVSLLNNTEFIKPTPAVRSTGNWAKALKDHAHNYAPVKNYMTIAWPDMGIPPVYTGFFKALHDEAQKQGIQHVLFYCMGGHGRTGTALAATLIEVCNYKPKDAVDWVRQHYCKEAVESESQKKFLLELWEEIHPGEGTDPGEK